LKVLNLGEKLFDKYNKENILLKKSSLDLAEKNSQLAVISFVINLFSTFGVIILGSIFFAFDLIDYGSVIAAVTLQTGITYMFLNLGTYINQMQVALVSAKRVMEIFDEKQENVAIEEKQIGFFPIRNSGIEYRNVSFVYNEKKVIDNLSLKISCGEKIAIVGASGSGKSTILKLLLRIYEVDNGEILMNGKNVSGMTCSDVRAAIAYVPQEPYIFHSSIYSNIDCMGKCSTEEFKKIVHLAAVDEFVDSMPKKYDSIVGGGVTKLSGGEKQRIGIARAWCKKSPIYLFDEATSALDYISEEKVMSQFMEENKESTVIMVTHRFSTLKYFDRILVIKNGNLEEECDYNAIVKRNIIYSDFLTSE
jgi:ATP-binding cassette subfamily B protein